jgi:purine-nucleoside phosphorylase
MATVTLPPAVLEARARCAEATRYLSERAGVRPRVGVVLGSGLGEIAHEVQGAVTVPYAQIPHFPVSTAPGHAGNLLFGTLGDQPVVLMQGRFHAYEGYTPQQVTFPIRVMKALGVETLVLTCAAGGLNPGFSAGDLMLIADHLNLTGNNPLIGANDPDLGPRFPVMFDAYRAELRKLARTVAQGHGLALQEGIYAGIAGPAFFTPAELQHLITIGADAIGMSTVPEAIVAAHMGLSVFGLALISDMARPDLERHATETEILATVKESAGKARALLSGLIPLL